MRYQENIQRSTLNVQGSTLKWPLISAAILIVGVSIWLGFKIPKGILTFQDELFTAERAREMVILGRDSVYYNFQPSFAKPPLQYWLTTLTLPRFENASAAVRIWPLIYGVLTAGVVGWLAVLIAPQRSWLVPLSVAMFVSCALFSTEATRALLDTGLMFFTTLAIAFAELARRRPAWWLGVAIACWLGALQKIPLIFLVWVIIIVVRLSRPSERAALSWRWILGSVLLAGGLVALWPVFQSIRFGMPGTRAFAGDDLGTLFGERQLGSRPYFEVLTGLMATGWVAGGVALAACIGVCLFRRERTPPLVFEMSVLSLVIVFLAVICNFRAVRYVLPIVPCLVVVLAFFLYEVANQNKKLRTPIIAAGLVLILGGFVQAEVMLHHVGSDPSNEQRIAQKLGEIQTGELMLVRPSPPAKRGMRSAGFYLFHGRLRSPLNQYTVDELRGAMPKRPAAGVCKSSDLAAIQSIYPDAEAVVAFDQLVCWRTGK